jgi:transcription elongation factor GreA
MNDYLRSLKPDIRRQHENFVRRYVDFMGEGFEVGQLTGSRVESYAESQIRPTDPNAQDRVAALKAWFQFLKKKDYVGENYGIHIRVRKAAGRAAAGRSSGQRKEEEPIEMTAEGIDALRAELAEIEAQVPTMEQNIAHAREDGDLRENAPYHAAREALAFKNQRKQQIETALKRAFVAQRSGKSDRSSVGSTVTVTRLDKQETLVFKLVGAREANAGEKKISVESPVGKELLGRRPGDEVEITVPSGVIQYRIDAVSHA